MAIGFLVLLLMTCWQIQFADILLTSSPNTNGSYCPVTVNFTCFATNEPIGLGWRLNGSIIDTYTFLNTGMERFPSVVFVNDIVTITVKNAVFIPPSTHNITSELSGNVSDLLGSTISCRSFQTKSEEFIVHFKVPGSPEVVSVYANGSLSQVKVTWSILASDCPGVEYIYEVVLQNSSSYDLECNIVRCISTQECVTYVDLASPDEYFRIQITATNDKGESKGLPYLSPLFSGHNISRLPTTALATIKYLEPEGEADVIIIATSIAATVTAVIIFIPIIIIILVCCRKKYLETKQSKQHIKSQDPVYDEVRTQKIVAGYKEGQSLQDDRIKVNANECYRKAQCDDINLKDCVAYSGLK